MELTLALDALETVKRAAHSSLLWQRLCKYVGELPGDARAQMVQRITALEVAPGQAEWLRCSVLADLTKDPLWYARQGAQADASWPADALMSLLGLAWHNALARATDRTQMIERLRNVDVLRLQRLIAAQLAAPQRPAPAKPIGRPGTRRLRIALYTPHIASPNHGGTLFSLNVMSVLAQASVDFHTFTAQENAIPAIGSYLGGNEYVVPVIAQPQTLQLKRAGEAPITLPNPDLSLHGRLQSVSDAIDAFAPDVVLFVGFISPLVHSLYERYPVLGLSVHAMPPLAPVDSWLCADPHTDAACWQGLPEPVAYPFTYRFWPVGQAAAVPLTSLNLPAGATVLISVGYRLEVELTAEWQARMLALVDRHPDTYWLLVGVGENVAMHSLPRHARIYRVSPQAQVQAWLAASDIFVNPPRVGGGGAVAMAMEQGVAVAALCDGDAGDKLGPFAAQSIDQYFATLEDWIAQPEVRSQAGAALKERFFERLDFSSAAAAQGLIDACYAASAYFQQRRGLTCE
ncbi:Glycosyltransferase involved in cell wall bisynthesis [Pseudomonas mohnii]|uniref:Glycosyltransferase involved in cell wall bisynthesis n=1 Tax=Pseudomonas mohnii TaxID=395600 RepID=A0ABY0YV07_9PSED|nr:glycosyltransferase family 1 protein [Pseudomonas mohnii]SEE00698.1 Glycosyltransferase involved in cell wall bisynthesis [Pseudomonas mohnii]